MGAIGLGADSLLNHVVRFWKIACLMGLLLESIPAGKPAATHTRPDCCNSICLVRKQAQLSKQLVPRIK